MRTLIFLLFLNFLSFNCLAQSDSSSLKISLLTCDIGDEAYAAFGHCAFRVIDKRRNKDIVFDYGIFDFDTPNFVWRFMRGSLDYKVAQRKTRRFMREYIRDKRGVREQQFNLPEAELIKIYDFLIENEKPENRYYKYNFLHDNCATRLRDIVNGLDVNPGNPVATLEKTFRNSLHDHLLNKSWLKLGIDILLGANTDRVMTYDQQMFLPRSLAKSLSYYTFVNQKGDKKKLLAPAVTLIPAQSSKHQFSFFQPLIVFVGILLMLVGLIWWKPKTSKWFFLFYCLVYGLAGCLLFFLWFATEHTATRMNWNLLWANPLYLLFLIPSKGIRSILTKVVFVLNMVILLFWWSLPQEINLAVLPLTGMFLFLLYTTRKATASQKKNY